MKNYGLFDVTFLFIRLYNITNVKNSPETSRMTTQRPHELEIDVCGLVPPERGLCKGHLRRYFFDRTKGQCVLFDYGGCGANLNFFMSEEQCLQRCGRKQVITQGTLEFGIDVCGLAPEKGSCQINSHRYFFDRTKGQCVLFTYGGCGGNMNNFFSEELCLQRCGRNEVTTQRPHELEIDVCGLVPPERGLCKGHLRRYFFDRTKGQCVLFDYSGCDANLNFFMSEEQCLQRCGRKEVTTQGTQEFAIDVCGLAPEKGRCQMNSHRYFFDRTKGQCALFTYSGCGGNMNNFFSEELCLQRCGRYEVTTQRPHELEIDVCGLVPPERGLCKGHLRRYFFDRTKGQCVLFDYGGCGANLNFFMSEEQCLQRCGRKQVITQGTQEFGIDVCGLAPEKGRCQMNSHRYFFDRTKGQCVLFTYGGCGGNMNNFFSEELCLQRCGRNEVTTQRPLELEIDVCGLVPPERGLCKGHLRRYFFDRTKGQCVLFDYGGCGANLNFFMSEEQCLQRCGRKQVTTQGTQEFGIDVCGLAPEKGRCQINFHRYFFDRTKGQCVLFTYGGCGGNMNNFFSEGLCWQRCGRNEGIFGVSKQSR